MKEKAYLILRKSFFWLFSLLFIISTPLFVIYSLGYKFDMKSGGFLKMGAISIKSVPADAAVSLGKNKINKTTPCVLNEVFPGVYTLTLEKDNYYSYQIPIRVKASAVSELDIVLVPKIQDMQKVQFDFNVYNFFVSKHILGQRIFVFTDSGIFLLDDNFVNFQKICSYNSKTDKVVNIEGFIEDSNLLVFWNKSTIWMLNIAQIQKKKEADLATILKAKKSIKNVFFGLREKYLIIQDGLEVIALDTKNSDIIFPVIKLNEANSEIVYDSSSETLYVKEKGSEEASFSLFRVDFFPSIRQRLSNEKNF
jgi:hypothetical protein